MRLIIGLIIIITSILIVIISRKRSRRGKLIFTETYSYKKVIKIFVVVNCFFILACLLIFKLTNSFEVTISLGVFMFACSIAGCLRVLLTQSHIQARGGRKNDGK
jgi:hypothetical protein